MIKHVAKWMAWVLLAGCAGMPTNAVAPKVSLADMNIKSLGLFEQRFDLGLRVTNPNDFDVMIEALDFELEVNGRPFAKGLSRVSSTIPAASSTILRVEAVTQSNDLLTQVKTLPPELLKEGVPYRIKGRVKTNKKGWLPFDHKGVYGGERQPKGQAT